MSTKVIKKFSLQSQAVEKLCRPSLREESAAAAFSCSQPDGLHGLGRVLRSSTVFFSHPRLSVFICG
jgi:hypothetical protein